ncbi:hypothetical protein HER32_08620 [Hymenobacter sp. BT18]|uniref:hypothetical protein n=1 Tax=Hymenobacter sp. BT18 TaxID=2835648 RepID=UPI00143E5F3E|nr:hypothetical protein [Hymenobacter sp. BT18]QIX61236.1 hypothetical protein HER32_08620 [Hymenobacter sp. BT18]
MMKPEFPLLALHQYPKDPYCYFIEDETGVAHCNLSGYYSLQKGREEFYDKKGAVWDRTITLKRSFGPFQKLLSYFYWASIPIENEWVITRAYSLDELKERVIACVKADDDILTQFVEEAHLLELVEQCRHFADIHMVLSNAIYNCEEDESLEE